MSNSDIQKINTNEVMSAVTVLTKWFICQVRCLKIPSKMWHSKTREILATIDELLALANTDKSRLLSAQLYLKNLSDFSTVNAIWVDWLKGCVAPSRATIHRFGQSRLVN